MFLQLLLKLHNLPDLIKKKHIDLGDITDKGRVHPQPHQLGNGVDAVIGSLLHILHQFLHRHMPGVKFFHMNVVFTFLQGADGFEKTLFKTAPHAHDLAGGFHLSGKRIESRRKFVKWKPGHLCDHIVQSRLKTGRSVGQPDLVEVHTHGDLCGHSRDRVSCGLGGQGRGPGDPGIDLDDIVPEGVRVQSKLYVAASFYFQGPDNFQGAVPEHVVFPVGERLAGSHHDGISRVDPHRIQILHIAHGDGGVVSVSYHFIFDLFISPDALLNKNLMDRRQVKSIFHLFTEFFRIICKAAARASQGKRRPENHRISYLFRCFQRLPGTVGDPGRHHRLSDALTQFFEKLPVLGTLDAPGVRSQKLDLTLIQHSFFRQGHGQIQTGLASDAGNNGIGPLKTADTGQIFQSQRFHIHLVCHRPVCHDRGRVGICQNHLIALFLQRQTRLGPRIIKFRGLADDNRTGAYNQHFFQIRSLRHELSPPSYR